MTIEEIEKMSYQAMLSHRRFAPVGTPEFVSGTPEEVAFAERFIQLTKDTQAENRIAASKSVGWGR